jgi:hypothetical protein
LPDGRASPTQSRRPWWYLALVGGGLLLVGGFLALVVSIVVLVLTHPW